MIDVNMTKIVTNLLPPMVV